MEAFDYAYDKCKDDAGGTQHPQIAGNIVGSFPIAVENQAAPVSFSVHCFYRSGATGDPKPLINGTTLKSGDTYKIALNPDEKLYAYIFQVDTSGQIFQLFPMKEFKGTQVNNFNPVSKGKTYFIPGREKAFKLDRNTGTERIYFLGFREPNEKIENLYKDLESARRGANDEIKENAQAKLARIFVKQRGIVDVVDDRGQGIDMPWGGDVFSTFGEKIKNLCEDCMYTIEFTHE